MTSVHEIAAWFDAGVRDGATHMLVVVDEFDHDDYPVYVAAGTDPQAEVDRFDSSSMQRVMEVYNLTKPKQPQLASRRVWDVDPAAPAAAPDVKLHAAPRFADYT